MIRRLLAAVAVAVAAPGCGEAEPTNDFAPMWSPDGRRILFTSTRSGNEDLYVMSADGSDVRRLTDHGADDAEGAWSPDGTRIAFCTDRDGNDEVYVMNADGSNPVNLTSHPAGDCMPSWSRAGDRIAFMTDRDGDWRAGPDDNNEIYVMNADGSQPRNLTGNPGYDLITNHAWTPGDEHIIFCSTFEKKFTGEATSDVSSSQYAEFDLYRIDPDGRNLTRLTFTYEEDSYPFVSSDGRHVYYARYLQGTGTGYDLYRMTMDGREVTRIVGLPHIEFGGATSPDGSRMVYASSDAEGLYSLFVAEPDGSNPVRLTGN